MIRNLTLLSLSFFVGMTAVAQHRVLVQGNNRLAIVEDDGAISWEMAWPALHDIHVLPNGNIMALRGPLTVAEIDMATQEVVWSYNATKHHGNKGKRVELHAFQPLPDGNVMIAESGSARIIEIDRDKNLVASIDLVVENPHPHTDTRLARKLSNGHYLACHERDGAVREYDAEGAVIWEFAVPMFDQEAKPGHGPEAFGNSVFSALRLSNGNTLIGTGNGHSVLEVTPEKDIIWALHQNDLPDITLAWVTTLEVLSNGNLVLGNCHAGPGQPLLVELNRETREVVWTFDRFKDFGNSVSNSLLMDQVGQSVR